jgi:tetratricopeptide (TPR) repeat protein
MNESLENIEAYFEKGLNDAEKQLFEERCVNDENFANEVAFYIMSREAIQEKLAEQKKQQWRRYENEVTEAVQPAAPVKKMTVGKWLSVAAAACIFFAAALVYFFTNTETSQSFADKYIKNNYQQLSQNMDASTDSLQTGIAAYNKQDYDKALIYFKNFYSAHPENSDAKKYTGLVYLMKRDYDKALDDFNDLAQKKGLFSNPGLFLQALTLLERNKGNDKADAKSLLEQVVTKKLDHSQEAAELLKKW